MRDGDDEFEDFDDEPAFPMTVTLAGVGWILFEGLCILSMLINLAGSLAAPEAGAGGPRGAEAAGYRAGQVCGGIFAGLIGGAFVFVGIQSIRGTARDTLGNSIGSIVFGMLYLGLSVLGLALGTRAGNAGAGMILAFIMFIIAAGLMGAGILGLVGRKEYKEWRRFEKNRI